MQPTSDNTNDASSFTQFFCSDIEIQISLWGQKALNFTIESSESSVEHIPTAILLTGCLVKAYQRTLVLVIFFPLCMTGFLLLLYSM